jgi:hypothetical protein
MYSGVQKEMGREYFGLRKRKFQDRESCMLSFVICNLHHYKDDEIKEDVMGGHVAHVKNRGNFYIKNFILESLCEPSTWEP